MSKLLCGHSVQQAVLACRICHETLKRERDGFENSYALECKETARLRAVIVEAPHAKGCLYNCFPGWFKCSCWKRDALKGKS